MITKLFHATSAHGKGLDNRRPRNTTIIILEIGHSSAIFATSRFFEKARGMITRKLYMILLAMHIVVKNVGSNRIRENIGLSMNDHFVQ